MKTKKRRLEYFSFYNHTGLEQHFNKMAKKGWLIESISNFYWTYRKIEPKDIHFCVTYYPRASDFDPEPSEDQQTFHDFCAHTGWQLTCTWHQMQVFYNEKESPIPLETDPIMEVDTLHRACKKNFLPSYYVMFALGLIMTGYFIAGIYFDPIGLLSSSSRLVSQFAYMCVFAISVVELVTYFRWHRKAAKAAQDGIFVDTPSTTKFQIFVLVLLLIAMVWWFTNLFAADDPLLLWVAIVMFIYIFGVIFIVNGIKKGLKKAKASRGLNKALTLAACFILPAIMTGIIVYTGISVSRSGLIDRNPYDDSIIPLSVSDFTEIDEDNYIEENRNHQTFLIGQRVVNMYPHWDVEGFHEMPDLRYTITTVKVPFLYDWCKEQVFYDQDESNNNIPEGHRSIYKEVDATPWDAETAFRLYHEEGWWQDTYLLCYEERIIEIRFDWEPTEEQMEIVGQKLNP